MIFDKIEHIDRYAGISPAFRIAADYLASLDPSQLPKGDIALDGERVYGFFRDFPLRSPEEVYYESHKRYIDIQYLVAGEEGILCTDADNLTVTEPYDSGKDIAFHGNGASRISLVLLPGEFAVFFPWDAHKPCLSSGSCGVSTKIVLKVSVEP